MQKFSINIFEKAQELNNLNYKEENSNFPLSQCDTILVNNFNQTYWFTKKGLAEHIVSLSKN